MTFESSGTKDLYLSREFNHKAETGRIYYDSGTQSEILILQKQLKTEKSQQSSRILKLKAADRNKFIMDEIPELPEGNFKEVLVPRYLGIYENESEWLLDINYLGMNAAVGSENIFHIFTIECSYYECQLKKFQLRKRVGSKYIVLKQNEYRIDEEKILCIERNCFRGRLIRGFYYSGFFVTSGLDLITFPVQFTAAILQTGWLMVKK